MQNLTDILNKAVDNQVLLLKGEYTLGGAVLTANRVRVLGNVKARPIIHLTESGVAIKGNQSEWGGLGFTNTSGAGWHKVFENVGQWTKVHDCTANAIDSFITNHGDHLTATKNVVTNAGGDVFYNAAWNASFIDNDVTLVQGVNSEHCYREDIDERDGMNNRVPQGTIVRGGTWTGDVNSHKETFAYRATNGSVLDSVNINGYIRAGQAAGDNHVKGLSMNNLNFMLNMPDFSLIDIKFGVVASLDRFNVGSPVKPFQAKQTFVSLAKNSLLTTGRNSIYSKVNPVFTVNHVP